MSKKLTITYLKKATKFLAKNTHVISEEAVDDLVTRFVKKKVFGVELNIDYKQMHGAIRDIYRIRKGNIRIILKLNNQEIIIEAIVQDIGYRGDIYKR